ncbi:MAG: TadE/TadG family type IV pilus assembly protein [Pseudomonadota bacterium]|uniref:TadE/TadG family type IV pilus assembly protein n=1 Tax=uncultured Sphingomonas sp. TaxID=158754 RepID=UPI0030F515F4
MKITLPPRFVAGPSRVRALARDDRGSAAVEFALVVTPLIALMIAIVQTSLTFFAQQNLETTAEKSVRALLTGTAQTSGMTQAQFKTLACSKLPAFMKCANLLIDVQAATAFSAVATAPPTITYDSNGNVNNAFQYAPGGTGSINVVKMMYLWDTQKGPLGFDLSTLSGGKRLLIATSVFKTEPYK